MSRQALAEFVDRVRNSYLPSYVMAWAEKHSSEVDPGTKLSFDPAEIKTTPETAAAFLRAVDEGAVELRPTSFGLPRDLPKGRCPIFDRPRRKTGRIPFLNEGPLDVAVAGRLVLDLGWPREHLGFRSKQDRFDVCAYDPKGGTLAIVAETKWHQSEVEDLGVEIAACGAVGSHKARDCGTARTRNHHNKFAGLIKLRPRLLVLVGPEASHVYAVEYLARGRLALEEGTMEHLRFHVESGPASVIDSRRS